jgi:hypothetical protein
MSLVEKIGLLLIIVGFARVLLEISGKLSKVIQLLEKERDNGEDDVD